MKKTVASQTLSRKEREKRIHQREILTAAGELFVQKGYHNTTLEEIARHAEFGKGTIYNYFSSKEELFLGIIEQLIEESAALADSAMNIQGVDVRTKFSAYARTMISRGPANAELLNVIFREMDHLEATRHQAGVKHLVARVRKVWEALASPLEEEIRSGHIRPLGAIKLAALFEGMLRFYCLNHFGKYRTLDQEDPEEGVRFIVSAFFDGVSQAKPEDKQ